MSPKNDVNQERVSKRSIFFIFCATGLIVLGIHCQQIDKSLKRRRLNSAQTSLAEISRSLGESFHKIESTGSFDSTTHPKKGNNGEIATNFNQGARKLYIEPPQDAKRRAFICITGQLARLELENKIATLIKPLQDHGYEIDVALVLAKGAPQFSYASKKEDRYDSDERVFDILYSLPSVRVLNNDHFSYEPLENPNPPAVFYMGMKMRDSRSFKDVFERTQMNYRMFESYKRCWDIERHSSGIPHESHASLYDIHIRLREDVGLEKPINMTLVNEFAKFSRSGQYPKLVLVSDCRSFRGINDRMALVSPAAAHDYYVHPYKVLSEDPHISFNENGPAVDWNQPCNTESLLKQIYEASDIHVVKSRFLRGVSRIVQAKVSGRKVDIFDRLDVQDPFCPEISDE